MDKAFFINGGAGRVLCAFPSLEKYAESNENFIVVAEGWMELFLVSPKLRDKVYHVNHNKLFEKYLKHMEIVSPEPYRLNDYYNQKVNLIQAFDILINGPTNYVPATTKINLELSKKEQVKGYNLVEEVRKVKNKQKVVVFQPFGSSVVQDGNFIVDSSGRSFELADTLRIIEELKKDYGVVLMSQIGIPNLDPGEVAWSKDFSLLDWMGIINACDYFVGCDSFGQHVAYSLGKPSTVVIGSTYPENISYKDEKNFVIIDVGQDKRKYSPFRICNDEFIERNNEALMLLDDKSFRKIIDSVKNSIGGKNIKSKFGAL